MKYNKFKLLVALIQDSKDPPVIFFSKLIQESKPKYSVGKAIPAAEVWEIYSKRQAWNESVSNPKRHQITGYDKLLKRLPRESGQTVRMHVLEWWDLTAVFFTDENISNLFGVLRIPNI